MRTPISITHPHRTLAVATVVIIAAAIFGLSGLAALRGGESDFNDPHTESQVARARLIKLTGVDSEQGFVVLVNLGGVRTLHHRPAIVTEVDRQLSQISGVREVNDYWASHDPAMLARDHMSTYVAAATIDVSQHEATVTRVVQRRLRSTLGGNVTVGGETAADAKVNDQVGHDLGTAERLVFPFLLIALVIVFRGIRVALTPLVCAIATLLLSLAVLHLLTLIMPISVYALNLVSALAVGLSIDYGLLVLSRHREEFRRNRTSTRAALTGAMSTAGRTIAMSAITLSVALCALLVFPQRFLYSIGLGGIVATLMALLVARTVLPALLMLLGQRALPATPSRRIGVSVTWARWARWVTGKPAPFAVVGTSLLLLAGIPFLHVKFVGIDASVLPSDASARQVATALSESFTAGSAGPVQIILTSKRPAAVQAYTARVAQTSGMGLVTPPRPLALDVWEMEGVTGATPLSAPARAVIRRLRHINVPGVEAKVGGTTANFVDLQNSIVRHIPLALLVLAIGMMAILFAVTASVVIPIKTFILNLLTISAVFGLLVLIFQEGRLTGLLDYNSQNGIETTTPVLLFAVTFGLATDYAVFVISRIKEAYEGGASTRDAVVIGVERTGRVVTAAALLFSIPAGAFATSSIVFLKELGVGVVLGVLIDAFIVRTLVVPAMMVLLGRWNWWCPESLRAIHRRAGLTRLVEFDQAIETSVPL